MEQEVGLLNNEQSNQSVNQLTDEYTDIVELKGRIHTAFLHHMKRHDKQYLRQLEECKIILDRLITLRRIG